MCIKRLLMASLGAFVTLVGVSVALFPVLFPDGPPISYENQREQPVVLGHLAAAALTSFLLAFIYPFGRGDAHPALQGARFGALMAVLCSFPVMLHEHAMIDVSLAVFALPAAWTVGTWALAGAVIGLVHGRADQGDG